MATYRQQIQEGRDRLKAVAVALGIDFNDVCKELQRRYLSSRLSCLDLMDEMKEEMLAGWGLVIKTIK